MQPTDWPQAVVMIAGFAAAAWVAVVFIRNYFGEGG